MRTNDLPAKFKKLLVQAAPSPFVLVPADVRIRPGARKDTADPLHGKRLRQGDVGVLEGCGTGRQGGSRRVRRGACDGWAISRCGQELIMFCTSESRSSTVARSTTWAPQDRTAAWTSTGSSRGYRSSQRSSTEDGCGCFDIRGNTQVRGSSRACGRLVGRALADVGLGQI